MPRDPKVAAMKKLVSVQASYKAAEKTLRALRLDRKEAVEKAVDAGNTQTAVARVLEVHATRVRQIIERG